MMTATLLSTSILLELVLLHPFQQWSSRSLKLQNSSACQPVNCQTWSPSCLMHSLKDSQIGSGCAQELSLPPTNDAVEIINNHVINKFPGKAMEYRSADSIEEESHQFPIEFINTFSPSGMPQHKLVLKKTSLRHVTAEFRPYEWTLQWKPVHCHRAA